MFTNPTNFMYGSLFIPNIAEVQQNRMLELKMLISEKEIECLNLILGVRLTEALLENVELDSEGYYKLIQEADYKWKWLLYGHTYESESGCCKGGYRKWKGLLNKVATVNIDENKTEIYKSLMAYYIYYYWSLDNRTMSTGIGEANGVSANTTQALSMNKRIDAWNKFVQEAEYGLVNAYVGLRQFLNDHSKLYEVDLVCKPFLNTMTYYDL